ncbi:hypothetical protein F5Y19DRAFT_470248 [Xylariaceae sp. FL1651]|nr:hypothetical protein F5Y19DRAFT_470248 [Xylariaceae sp. FL1651]
MCSGPGGTGDPIRSISEICLASASRAYPTADDIIESQRAGASTRCGRLRARAREDARVGLRRVGIVGALVLREAKRMEATARAVLARLANHNEPSYGQMPESVALPFPPFREPFDIRHALLLGLPRWIGQDASKTFRQFLALRAASRPILRQKHTATAMVQPNPRRRNDWLWMCCWHAPVKFQTERIACGIQLASTAPFFLSPRLRILSHAAILLRDSAANSSGTSVIVPVSVIPVVVI